MLIKKIKLSYLLLFVLFCSANLSASSLHIQARALYKGGAVLEINGHQHVLKAGKSSPEGVKLLAADSKKALIEHQGKKQTLTLTRAISSHFTVPEKSEVRIPSGSNGHYFTPGRINNRQVDFLVDTGASTVAMSSVQAMALGLNYQDGRQTTVNTASGQELGYIVDLHQVGIGNVSVDNVKAIVIEGRYPKEILLGNTYLNKVEMEVDAGVLILRSKF